MLTPQTIPVAPDHVFDIEELMAEEFALVESVGGTWKGYRKVRRVSAYRLNRAQRKYIFSLYESMRTEQRKREEADRELAEFLVAWEAERAKERYEPTAYDIAEYYRAIRRHKSSRGGQVRDFEAAILARQERDLYPELSGY